LIDLDEYRPGPFAVAGGRLPGSVRFMPPEHLTDGATVDERSTVFLLGRTAQVLLDEGDVTGRWRAPEALRAVAARATAPDPADRYPTVADLVGVWRLAAS